jgi:hypothetical protein
MHNLAYYSGIGNKFHSNYNNVLGNESSSSRITSQMYETGLRSIVEQKAGNRHSLTYGIHATYQRFSPQTTSHTKDEVTTERGFPTNQLYTGSLFFEDRISLGRVTLDAGVRASLFNNHSNTVWGVEPRFSANLAINENNKTYLSYTRSLQPLISIMKPYLGFPLDFWMPYDGNTISSSDQISAGWSNTRLRNLTFTLESYYKHLQGISLILTPDDYLAGESTAMQATGYAYGIEFMAVYTRNRLSLTGAYTYSRSMRTVEGATFPFTYDIPHDFNIFTTYTTKRTDIKNHTLSLNVHCRSGLPFVMSEGIYLVDNMFLEDNPFFPNTRLKPYFRSDVSYSMERAKRKGSRIWQISILNVTGHTNPYIVHRSGEQYKYLTLIPFMPSFSYRRTF